MEVLQDLLRQVAQGLQDLMYIPLHALLMQANYL